MKKLIRILVIVSCVCQFTAGELSAQLLAEPEYFVATDPAHPPFGVITFDLNGDGRLDLATSNLSPNTIGYLINDGAGFGSPNPPLNVNAVDPLDLGRLDLTGDGFDDVVVIGKATPWSTPGGIARVLESDGAQLMLNAGAEKTAIDVNPDAPPQLLSGTLGDMNGDGLPDLVLGGFFMEHDQATSSPAPSVISVFPNLGTEVSVVSGVSTTEWLGFGANVGPYQLSDVPGSRAPRQIACADFDRDGLLDVFAAFGNGGTNLVGNSVGVVRGGPGGLGSLNWPGEFGTVQVPKGLHELDLPNGEEPMAAVIVDLDHDGWDDAAVLTRNTGHVWLLMNRRDSKLLSIGAGGVVSWIEWLGLLVLAEPVSVPSGAFDITAGDLDEDCWPELVVSADGANAELVVLGNEVRNVGDMPQFVTLETHALPSGSQPRRATIADLDGDGDGDVALALAGDADAVPPGRSVAVYRSISRQRRSIGELTTPTSYAIKGGVKKQPQEGLGCGLQGVMSELYDVVQLALQSATCGEFSCDAVWGSIPVRSFSFQPPPTLPSVVTEMRFEGLPHVPAGSVDLRFSIGAQHGTEVTASMWRFGTAEWEVVDTFEIRGQPPTASAIPNDPADFAVQSTILFETRNVYDAVAEAGDFVLGGVLRLRLEAKGSGGYVFLDHAGVEVTD